MTIEQFRQTLAGEAAPEGISAALHAMWHDAKGNWTEAHEVAQGIDDRTGSWVHAYLHRKEGDLGNAGYWYRRAGQPTPHDPLEQEWARIVSALLRTSSAVFDDK
jgi:hypothetical protein